VKFTNPKNDLSFKKTFGNKKNKNILISFLNAVLDFKADKEIVDVEELKTILDINFNKFNKKIQQIGEKQ